MNQAVAGASPAGHPTSRECDGLARLSSKQSDAVRIGGGKFQCPRSVMDARDASNVADRVRFLARVLYEMTNDE